MPRPRSVLASDVLATMLAHVTAAPSTMGDAAAAHRIKQRVLGRVAPGGWRVLDQPGWRPWVDKADKKILFDDGATRSWLVRMRPGAALPAHVHDDGDEECVVLQGELWVDGRHLSAGDYTVALRGSRHDSVCTSTGALIYLRSPSPRRSPAVAMA